MTPISQSDIHFVAQHLPVTEQQLAQGLQQHLYQNKTNWKSFLKYFFLTLGLGFIVAGMIFFFAYNWASLPSIIKLVLVQTLVVVCTVLALLPKINVTYRKILLTAAAVLIGVMFAVFGQIYQTGANAYDFFLAWTIFAALFAFAANFTPLWLIFVGLINVTIFLYAQQVTNWSTVFLWQILFVANTIAAGLFGVYKYYTINKPLKNDLFTTVLLAAIFTLTVANCCTIFGGSVTQKITQLVITAIFCCTAYFIALRFKNLTIIAGIALTLIISVVCIFIQTSSDSISILLATFFTAAAVAATIFYLISLHKLWLTTNPNTTHVN
jgi:uncharacterized membrane protein